ncbi:hypothetical protein [Hydrogenimonas sp. SS33]|uniref:WD40 repeat domain-containing protein n=1 Tax=Hydrogenimonas leucolamina TaxID=2954236 RepID=UPI00336C2AEF
MDAKPLFKTPSGPAKLFALLLFTLSAWAIGPWHLEKRVWLPGAYFFTPALSGPHYAAFGYVGKAKPTPAEIEAERKRIRAIIDGSIRREYGSWENYEKAMRRAGESAAEAESREASAWIRKLMPPSLVKETVPLLLKGALMWVMAHPEGQSEPFGNLGKTGVMLLDETGRATQIPIGIDQPVVSMDFSPDGRWLAVLSDMSSEEENGRVRVAGRISVIDLSKREVVREWVLANAADQIRFSPDSRRLGFLVVKPGDPGEKALRFIDTARWKMTKEVVTFSSIRHGGKGFRKERHSPYFLFLPPKGKKVALLLRGNSIGCREVSKNKPLFTIRGGGGAFAVARTHPWLFDDNGRLWACDRKKVRLKVRRPGGYMFNYTAARFIEGDRTLLAVDHTRRLQRIDTESGRVQTADDAYSRHKGGPFFVSPDERYIFAPYPAKGNRIVHYGPLRRKKMDLNIFETRSLRLLQTVSLPGSTVIDAAVAGERLFVGDFDTIYIYRHKGGRR